MSNRKSMLATEVGGDTPGSPLRRSSRIANSPAPAATVPTTPASVARRRSSAADTGSSTPAKITRRQSLSHDITEKSQSTTKTPSKLTRAASLEPESAQTPTRRGRLSSITKKDKEVAAAKPETPSRHRSIKAGSTSPSREASAEPVAAPKPRGRRPSLSQVNLEAIKETDAKAEDAEPKKVTRRTTRRSSVDANQEPELKKEEKKPATRRSIRGRSASIDIPEESEVKTESELVPINEEETEVEVKVATPEKKTPEVIEEKKTSEVVKEMKIDEDPKDKQTSEDIVSMEIQSDQKADAEVAKVTSAKVDDDVVTIDDDEEEATEKKTTPTKTRDVENATPSPSRKSRKSLSSESDSVFKSPVRRSPRLSASPVFSVETKSSPSRSPLVDDEKKFESTESTSVSQPDKSVPSPKKATVNSESASPRRSPRLSISIDENKESASPRRSPRLSESQENMVDKRKSSVPDTESENLSSPKTKKSLSLRVSESDDKHETETTTKAVEDPETILLSDDDEITEVPTPQSTKAETPDDINTINTEKRKSASFSLNDSDHDSSTTTKLSKSWAESNILNTSKTFKDVAKSPNKEVNNEPKTPLRRDSILKYTPEMVSGSDGSFHLNLSIPTTNSIDIDDGEDTKNVIDSVLDASGSSNSSDKENGCNKINVSKSPRTKRLSLNESSTPKLNNSVKMQSFCEPIEVEFSTDVVAASAQVVPKTPIKEVQEIIAKKAGKNSQNDSIIEVDNEDEFGTSPIKAMKRVSKNVTQSEDELEDELMNSFVDEVVEVEDVNKVKQVKDTYKEITAKDIVDLEVIDYDDDHKEDKSGKLNKTIDKSDEKISVVEESENMKKTIEASEESSIGRNATNGGSKRRKLEIKEISQELDDLINRKLKQAEEESSSEDDDDYEPRNEFVCDMASEGEEDTPSDDSNEIIDEGESLHSSDSEDEDDDDDYENDSFITDDEDHGELLSGNEYDLEELEDVKKNKKKRSRIVKIVDSSEDEVEVVETVPKKVTKEVEDEQSKSDAVKKGTVVILQNIKIPQEAKDSVMINEQDNLKSLESMKGTLGVEVPRDPKPSMSTPNNSISESPGRRPRRKTSISIQDQIKISRYSDGEISDKITKAVDFFVSSIKEKSGNVSVNVSLDYANNSASSADEGSPRKNKRVSLKKEVVENINDVVDHILETTVNDQNVEEEEDDLNESKIKRDMDKKEKKRVSSADTSHQNISMQFEVDDEIEEQNQSVSKAKKSKKRLSHKFEETDVMISPVNEKKRRTLTYTKNAEDVMNENAKRLSTDAQQDEVSPKKVKLNKSLSDIDLGSVKRNKSKQQQRLSLNKSVDSASVAIDTADDEHDDVFEVEPIQKKTKKNKKAKDFDLDVELTDLVVPAKKKLTKTSKLWEIEVHDEPNAFASQSEIIRPSTSVARASKKWKKTKPSLSNVDNTWCVQDAVAEKPSKSNKDKIAVKTQLATLNKKLAPNDFKNQMIYGSNVKRMASKDILKNKAKAGFNRKQK